VPASQGRLYVAWAPKFRRFGAERSQIRAVTSRIDAGAPAQAPPPPDPTASSVEPREPCRSVAPPLGPSAGGARFPSSW